MSTDLKTPTADQLEPLMGGALPRVAPVLVGVCSAALGVLAWLLGVSPVVGVVVAWIAYVVGYTVWSRSVEGSRKATDALMRTLMWTAFVLAMLPLVSLIWTVVARGLPVLTPAFLNDDMSGRALLGVGGGIYHAIMGTVTVTAIAAIIAIPIGLFTAIYLVEYGRGRLARSITFLVDVMTGIPSIVAGLFAYAMFVLFFGPGVRFGIGGAVALSVLMVPVVVRAGRRTARTGRTRTGQRRSTGCPS